MSTLTFEEARQIILERPQDPDRILNDYGADVGDYYLIAYHSPEGEPLYGESIVSKTERREIFDMRIYSEIAYSSNEILVGNVPEDVAKRIAAAT